MKKLLIAISMILASCVTVPKSQLEETDEFRPYIRLFEVEAKRRGITLNRPITSVMKVYKTTLFEEIDKKAGVIGLCAPDGDDISILINATYWDKANSSAREALIFHELGHCILGLPHDESTSSEGIPLSIMYPSDFDATIYANHREKYLDVLFLSADPVATPGERQKEAVKCYQSQ